MEYESHNLPEIKLCKFSRDPSKWPKFTENFKLKCSFQNYLFKQKKNGETPQRFRQGGKKDGSVYWTKWHILSNIIGISKTSLWTPNVFSYLKLKTLFNQPQLQARHKLATRSFQ